MHCGYVVKVESLRKHTNADKLQIATFFGNDTSVDLSVKVGDIGVYFPVDLQLSEEYCARNNLVRKKDANGNNIGGFLDPNTRNIKAIKLRGEKSDGLFMPLRSFAYCYDIDLNAEENKDVEFLTEKIPLNVGDQVSILNDHEICKKYIPRRKHHGGSCPTRKHKIPYSPLFAEHADTQQLAYNLSEFKPGDEIEITLKMHGTSQRTGYLPVLKPTRKTFWQKLFKKEPPPTYAFDYVSGTRRVVMEEFEDGSSFVGINKFREPHHQAFVGKLNKGETVYYEVVGFTDTGNPIMSNADNSKTQDKEFIKQYGKETVFSYGCSHFPQEEYETAGDTVTKFTRPQSDIYVYRMTMTNEDGFVVEYTPDFMRYRCEQMGVKTVPVFAKMKLYEDGGFLFRDDGSASAVTETELGNFVIAAAEEYYDGPDPVGKTHIREGVVVRIINRPKFVALKHKNFFFKVIEGAVKDVATAPDMEEAQEVTE